MPSPARQPQFPTFLRRFHKLACDFYELFSVAQALVTENDHNRTTSEIREALEEPIENLQDWYNIFSETFPPNEFHPPNVLDLQ
jgi:hypothetical protein